MLDFAASCDNCGTSRPPSVHPARFNRIDHGPGPASPTFSDGKGYARTCAVTGTAAARDLVLTGAPEYCGVFDGDIPMISWMARTAACGAARRMQATTISPIRSTETCLPEPISVSPPCSG